MIRAGNLYKIRAFDISYILEKIKKEKIKIYKLKQISEFTYTFISPIIYEKKLKILFANIEIVKKVGYLSILISLLKYKTTLVAMIISIFFYISLSNRIWKINVIGDSESLDLFIKNQLLTNNIYVGAKKLDVNELSTIQNKILYVNYDVIESIEENGCAINVNYHKKRKENDNLKFKGNLYAKKDGMIKSFDLLSGEKVVKINDYVKTGDLLVKDILTTDYNQEIYIGTYGSVYAYTWYYITVDQTINNASKQKETILANLLLEIKSQISLNFTENEYICEENMLQFKVENDRVYLKMHFTCVEDIAKE